MGRPLSKETAEKRASDLQDAIKDKIKGDWAFYPLMVATRMQDLLRRLHTLSENSDNPDFVTEFKEINQEAEAILRTYGYTLASLLKPGKLKKSLQTKISKT